MADRIIARTDRPLQASNIVVALFFIATVTFLSLSPVLRASFLNIDDNTYVTQNSDITTLSWQGVKRVFSSSYVSMYIPVTMLSYSLEYRFFRLNPAAYHTTNLLLHIANCCLVFWLVLLLSGNNMPAAFFTALFFGIHPLRVESVAWIAERKDVLCALFFIGTLISYSYYKLSGRKKFYYVSFALFVFALLSKPMTVTLPFVMLLFDHYYRGRLSLTDLKEKIPFLTTAFLGGVVTLITQGSTNAISTAHSFLSNVLVAAHGILFYLWKTLVPVDLSAYYPYPAHVMTARFLLSPVLLALLILLVWKGARR
ncbi:MAG TPA: hypothetical protein VJC03_08625, partial [bacterium]|nr:hypothetical protein [bacterium]